MPSWPPLGDTSRLSQTALRHPIITTLKYPSSKTGITRGRREKEQENTALFVVHMVVMSDGPLKGPC